MYRKHMILVTLLLLIAVAVVACGGGEKAEPTTAAQPTVKAEAATQPTPTTPPAKPTVAPTTPPTKPTVAPTTPPTVQTKEEKPAPTPVPTEVATEAKATATSEAGETGEEEIEYKLPDELQDIHSYRMKMTYKTTFGGQTFDVFHYIVEAVRDPEAKHVIIESAQAAPAKGEEPKYQVMEFIQKEGKMWLNIGGSWMMSQDEGSTDYGEELRLYTPEDLGRNWKKVGQETVNGVKTTHYRTTEVTEEMATAPLATYWGTWHPTQEGEGEPQFHVKKVEADVYVSDKGLIIKEIVRWVVDVTQNGKTEEATDELITEITDINADITIEVPEEAAGNAQPPIPLPAEATQSVGMGNLYIYEVAGKSVEETIAYFQKELPKQGYTVEGQGLPGMFKVTAPDGKLYSVTVTEGDSGGVQIMIQTGGF